MAETNTTAKQLSGYRIIIAILAVVLVALSLLYYGIHRQQQADYVVLSGERDTIQENLTEIMAEFESLETTNTELQAEMDAEKARTEEMIAKLTKERDFNVSKLRQYERDIRSLRQTVSNYLAQIDSLNTLNASLMSENVDIKKQLTSTELRAEEAEELARQLEEKVRKGSLLVATGIEITPLNKKARAISRIKRAAQISIDFIIAANKLSEGGNTEIIARVTSPDGYVLTTEALPTFNLNGASETYTASREVDFQNTDLPVSIFYAGDFVSGLYVVELYNNGAIIGSAELNMR